MAQSIGKKLAIWLVPLAMILLIGWVVMPSPSGLDSGDATGEIWTCSMHPQVRLPKPGPCPICGMKLIPLSQLKSEQTQTAQRANIETEAVAYRELFKEIRTVGKVDYNERRVKTIAARVAGRVDRVYADFTGIEVKRNDHLVEIYSPMLVTAQSEFLRALEASETTPGDRRFAKTTLDSARTKLQLWGILPEQIAELERNRKEHTHLTLYAPLAGTIVEKMVREGMYVEEGEMLYRIAELDPIWLYVDIYESDLNWIRLGQKVEVTVEAYPGEVFPGTVVFIDPFLNDQTRTVKVRVNLPNPDRRLKPAMYASARIRVRLQTDGTPEPTGLEGKFICTMHPEVVADQSGKCTICEMPLEKVPLREILAGNSADSTAKTANRKALAIRASAVLDTGRRQITYRQTKEGAFELLELKLGPRAEAATDGDQTISYFPVLSGLKDGDQVVIRGGFMVDSQRQIEGLPSLLYVTGQSAANLHSGHGAPTKSDSPPINTPAMPPNHKH